MNKIKVTTKRAVPGFILATSNGVFPITHNKTNAVLQTKLDWIDSNQLWRDTDTNRVFTPVLLGSGIYWMDAVTGTVYNVYTGQCQSTSTMRINLQHLFLDQKACGDILLSLTPMQDKDV